MTMKHLTDYLNKNKLTYQQYLQSEHWRELRRRFWASKLHNRTCFACNVGNKPLEMHHKTYTRIGHERLQDLCLLCRDCHQAAHDLNKGKKGGLWKSAQRVMLNIKQTGDRLAMLKGKAAHEWKKSKEQ